MKTLPLAAKPRRPAVDLARRPFSVGEVEAMLEAGILDPDEKFELIRGEIVPMSPEKSRHAQMKADLARFFGRVLRASLDVGNGITIALPDGLLEADVLIWQPIARRAFIAIDRALLAIEVADSSLAKDRDVKAPDYGRAGLPELWIVDLKARETLVYRLGARKAYARPKPVPFDQPLAALCAPNAAITLQDLD
jgi:Uma2 family endonuclease